MFNLFSRWKTFRILVLVSALIMFAGGIYLGQLTIGILYLVLGVFLALFSSEQEEKRQMEELIQVLGEMYLLALKPGDLIDRITIIEIKLEKIKKADLVKELNALNAVLFEGIIKYLFKGKKPFEVDIILNQLDSLKESLKVNNQVQWDWEDKLRQSRNNLTESGFVALEARKCNDKRTILKNKINELFGVSRELKSY